MGILALLFGSILWLPLLVLVLGPVLVCFLVGLFVNPHD